MGDQEMNKTAHKYFNLNQSHVARGCKKDLIRFNT